MVYLIIGAAIVALDMLTKLWAVTSLKPIFEIQLWKNVFHLTYVENKGAAFGILQNSRIFFIVATVLVLCVIFYIFRRFKNRSRLLNIGLTFVSAGAIGNLIDRIFRGFVVDFFDFCLISFPVFNVADIFVCVGDQ